MLFLLVQPLTSVIGLPLNGTGFGFTVTVNFPVTPGVDVVLEDVVVVVEVDDVLGDVGVLLELLHDELSSPAADRNTTGHKANDLRNIHFS